MREKSLGHLETDAYKYSMAEAGFPLREETFYFSFRKGGWYYNPLNLQEEVNKILQKVKADLQIDGGNHSMHIDYPVNNAMDTALTEGKVFVKAVPKGQWFYEREPILSVTGPSFLVSLLEPLILQLHFPIQVATQARMLGIFGKDYDLPWTGDGNHYFPYSCEDEKEIYQTQAHSAPYLNENMVFDASEQYAEFVRNQARKLKNIIEPWRIFEVGLRAATCMEQHFIACKVLKEEGITKTSNMSAGEALIMDVVGTMGHEHIQRWGNDLGAYRAMRDMRVGKPSYLLDTFDTISSGIPNAIKVMKEKKHDCSIRYDSGDKFAQYLYAHGEFKKHDLFPVHILEDGLSDKDTQTFEELRKITNIPENKQLYGYGGFLVSRGWRNPLTRDRVSAVYKLTETSSEPRMKFGNESGIGKQSIPGRPVTWRKTMGEGPLSIVAQDGEQVPENYVCISNAFPDGGSAAEHLRYSNTSQVIVESIRKNKEIGYNLSRETKKLIKKLERNQKHESTN